MSPIVQQAWNECPMKEYNYKYYNNMIYGAEIPNTLSLYIILKSW